MAEKRNEVRVSAEQLAETYRADQARMDLLQRRQQGLLQIANEMTAAIDAVKEIKKAEEGESIMVSLGAGIFAEAKITNVKKVKASLAGNILIDSEPEKALAELQTALDNARKDLETVQLEIQKVGDNMQGIATIIQHSQMAAAQQAKGGSNVSSVS